MRPYEVPYPSGRRLKGTIGPSFDKVEIFVNLLACLSIDVQRIEVSPDKTQETRIFGSLFEMSILIRVYDVHLPFQA